MHSYHNNPNVALVNEDLGDTTSVSSAVADALAAAFAELPTTDPAVAGAIWNDSGVLKISAGA